MLSSHAADREELEESLELGLRARSTVLSVLQTLSLAAIGTGVLLAITAPSTGPSFTLLGRLPGWPEAWGSMLAVMGLGQLLAVLRRSYAVGAVLSAGIGLWYLALAGAFAAQWWRWAAGPETTPDPSVYPVGVYAGLCAVHVVVADLLRRNRRARRRAGS